MPILAHGNSLDCDCNWIKGSLPSAQDMDIDGIADSCEQKLAEKYAPVVYHSSDETNYPTNVDWFLSKTSLRFYNYSRPDFSYIIADHPTQAQLIGHVVDIGGKNILSNGTRSRYKLITFFLDDLPYNFHPGSLDSSEWTTYYHVYMNDAQNTEEGITIQYWRFYAYNDAVNDHGGDWEGIHIILDKTLKPLRIGLLSHNNIDYEPYSKVRIEEGHPVIFSEGGGHGSRLSGDGIQAVGCGGLLGDILCAIRLDNPKTY
ncbi:MAG: hypothetical protein LUO89_09900, partial [Methanothrix sp.]|nr:hypothetical protein [Methanothrix sp.]